MEEKVFIHPFYQIRFVSKSYKLIKDNLYAIKDNLDFTIGLLSA